MYPGPMEKYRNWPSFSANTLWSEIWEHLNCEHNYTPTETTPLEQTSTSGGQSMHADTDSPLTLPHKVDPSSCGGPQPCWSTLDHALPVSPAPPEDQARGTLLHFQWHHWTSFRMVPRPICKIPHRMDLRSCFPLSFQVTNPRRCLGG